MGGKNKSQIAHIKMAAIGKKYCIDSEDIKTQNSTNICFTI